MILARGHNFSRKFNLGFNVVLSKTIQRRIICLILYRSWLNWLVTSGGIISTAKNGNENRRRREIGVDTGIWTPATLVGGGECSHNYGIRWYWLRRLLGWILPCRCFDHETFFAILSMHDWPIRKSVSGKFLEAVRWELVPGLPPALCPFVLRLPVNISFPLAATGSPGMD